MPPHDASVPSNHVYPFSVETMRIVEHCAQECEYQRSGEMSVSWMVNAWKWAYDCAQSGRSRPDLDAVKWLGKLVEPRKNKIGFRVVGVRVGLAIMPPFREVPERLERLLSHERITPAEFFKEYEEIHPFVDGNGRTGNILYNWLMGTLHNPQMPPDFWDQGRKEGIVKAKEVRLASDA